MLNVDKLAAAVAYILQKYGGRLPCAKLIKLAYLADRESINATGSSITTDTFCSSFTGPAGENLCALIKGEKPPAWGKNSALYKRSHSAARRMAREACALWNARFMADGECLVACADDLPTDWLSEYSAELIDSVDARFHDATAEELIEWARANCAEWQDPWPAEKRQITLAEILKALGWSKKAANWAIAEARLYEVEDLGIADVRYRHGTQNRR